MNKKNIADFYPLTPMQQGMLFHTLAAPESQVYVEQTSCLLQGSLHVPTFVRAWEQVVERHAILRTGFLVKGVKEPIQLVYKQVTLPVVQKDWQTLSEAEQAQRLDAFATAECARGFDLGQPPLMRLAFLRTGADCVRFVWTFHHILMDGWSLPILLQEVFALYEMLCSNRQEMLPTARPFRDYIVWLKKQDTDQAATFWQQTLAGFTTPTPLTARTNRPQKSDRPVFKELERVLTKEQTAVLQTVARQHQLTLNTLVQGAWALLLHRYSDEDDVLFGATVSGRPPDLPGAEMMVGLFINTLPVRVRIDDAMAVAAWLQALQEAQLAQRQYEFSPLTAVQKWSEVPGGQPLFESILVFENYPIEQTAAQNSGDLTISDIRSVEQTNYPLTVVAGEADALHVCILYDTGQFADTAVSRMLAHLVNLLTGMAANPTQPLGTLSLLTDAELRLMQTWNDTAVSHPQDRSVVQLFEAMAAQYGEKTAVCTNSLKFSYRELNEQANQFAHLLIERGVSPGDLIALSLPRSPQLIICVLATLKAGAAYLPIDPTYPNERIRFMLEDAQPKVIIAESEGRSKQLAVSDQQSTDHDTRTKNPHSQFTIHNSQFIILPSNHSPVAHYPITNLPIPQSPDSLAYIIYTSGSTGRPKGVMIEQAGLLNLIHWHQRAFGVTAVDRATLLAGPGFDASVWEMWPYLTAGAALHIPDDTTRAHAEGLRDWLIAHEITITFLPTPLAEQVLILPWPEHTPLRLLLTGGDRLHQYPPPSLPFMLVNNYGPTENSVVTTSGIVPVQKAGEETAVPPTIGHPIDNTQLAILDRRLRPVPVGVPGELHISGIGVARGYLNREELSAEKFIYLRLGERNFNRQSSACNERSRSIFNRKFYKSGDRCRRLPDGTIEFLGRMDQQVKIRGVRIELGEIEGALARHDGIETAVVTTWHAPSQEKRLIAYIKPTTSDLPSDSALRAFLQQSLPKPMIPTTFIPLETIPVTANGKINRRALPDPAGFFVNGRSPKLPPRDPIEAKLAAIWEDVLDTRPIGILDDFFALGGHSLLAVRLITQIEQAFGQMLTLTDLLQGQTIAALAQKVRHKRADDAPQLLVPIQTQGEKRPLFFIHPSGGSVHWYLQLAQSLGEKQPFYGIQAQGMHDEQPPHNNFPDMAADYITHLRRVQPHGPYLIGSWSLGVIIAYEMARQLTTQGETVAALIMFDQGPNFPHAEPVDQAAYLVETFGKNVPLSLKQLRTLAPDEQITHVYEQAQQVNWLLPDLTVAQFRLFIRMMKTHTAAWRAYVPQSYLGKIALFRAEEQEAQLTSKDMGWGDLAQGGVTIIPVPGNHLTMLQTPHVQVLAERLNAFIDDVSEGF